RTGSMNIAIGCYYNKTLFDPDYQTNVLDVAETAGFTLPKYKTLQYQNRLMKDMKNIGFYQIQDTLANFAIGSLGFEQFGKVDWKKMGNIYTPFGGLIYSPQGIEGNGVNYYVLTNYNTTTMSYHYTLNNASRGCVSFKSKTYPNINDSLINSVYGLSAVDTMYDWAGNQKINIWAAGGATLDGSGAGCKILNRTSAAIVNMINKGSINEAS